MNILFIRTTQLFFILLVLNNFTSIYSSSIHLSSGITLRGNIIKEQPNYLLLLDLEEALHRIDRKKVSSIEYDTFTKDKLPSKMSIPSDKNERNHEKIYEKDQNTQKDYHKSQTNNWEIGLRGNVHRINYLASAPSALYIERNSEYVYGAAFFFQHHIGRKFRTGIRFDISMTPVKFTAINTAWVTTYVGTKEEYSEEEYSIFDFSGEHLALSLHWSIQYNPLTTFASGFFLGFGIGLSHNSFFASESFVYSDQEPTSLTKFLSNPLVQSGTDLMLLFNLGYEITLSPFIILDVSTEIATTMAAFESMNMTKTALGVRFKF